MRSQQRNWRKFIWLLLLFTIIGIGWVITTLVKTLTLGDPTPTQHYAVSDAPSQFQRVWSLDNMYDSGFSATRPMLLATSNNEIFFLGYSAQDNYRSLIMRIEPSTGQVIETIRVSKDAQAIASDDRLIYIGVGSKGKILGDDLEGAAQIIAYDIVSGTQAWSQQIRGAREILSITPQGTRLFITTSYSRDTLHYLDTSSGRIISSNNETNTTFGSIYFPPILDDGIYIGQFGPRVSVVYGLEATTSNLLWQTDDIAYGNVAVNNGVAYFLTNQTELLAINVRNGQTITSVQLVPDIPQDQLSQRELSPFDVTVSGDIVAVYMGDSFQLFAFRFSR